MEIEEAGVFSKLDHITIVVKDMEKTIKYYSSLGLGPFVQPSGHSFPKMEMRGEPMVGSGYEVMTRETRIGPAALQLVQPVGEKSLPKEYLDRRGEGVFHIGFWVDDIDKAQEEMVKKGFKVTWSGRREDGTGFAFFDTEAIGGVIWEIKSFK